MAQPQGLMPALEVFDSEFGGHEDNVAPGPKGKNRVRFVALLSLLLGAGLVGVLALAWPLFAVSSGPEGGSNKQIDTLLRERDLLKEQIGEVAAAQEKAIATIAALNATVQELRQRMPSDQYWYSDLAALHFRIGKEQKSTAAPVARISAEVPAKERRENNARRRDPGAPQSLSPPQ
jgi:hypothetical protein